MNAFRVAEKKVHDEELQIIRCTCGMASLCIALRLTDTFRISVCQRAVSDGQKEREKGEMETSLTKMLL